MATSGTEPATGGARCASADGSLALASEPKEVYGPEEGVIRLRLGNGGAGPTGILRALSDDYLAATGERWRIAWIQTISRLTLENLRRKVIDVSLTYEPELEAQAVGEGWASEHTRVLNDHFLIVGPAENPAGLTPEDSGERAFAKIAALSASPDGAKLHAGFLTRHDGSGTNHKERQIWELAGHRPWTSMPAWYAVDQSFPASALQAADRRGLYHITDRGTFLSVRDSLRSTRVFVQGGAMLLNPCSALLQDQPSREAQTFLAYLRSDRAQRLIEGFGAERYAGDALFTPAAREDFARRLEDRRASASAP